MKYYGLIKDTIVISHIKNVILNQIIKNGSSFSAVVYSTSAVEK